MVVRADVLPRILLPNAPHPLPLPASGEREGPAKREGEGQRATDLPRFAAQNDSRVTRSGHGGPLCLRAADPGATGLVTSLARPGGNLTGVSFLVDELMQKRLELLSELVPQATVVALLVNPNNESTPRIMRDVQEAARVKGLQLPILKAGTESEIDAAFASLVEQQAGALVVGADPFFTERREQLVALASHHAVPVIYSVREIAAAGGLISYGASLTAVFRQLGTYAGKILKGAKPADLPVQQPTKFELVINLKTAKALGLDVPLHLEQLADEVIE
jgi:putative ABC transport system substrate-binding protein